jgi:hypothetical protein
MCGDREGSSRGVPVLRARLPLRDWSCAADQDQWAGYRFDGARHPLDVLDRLDTCRRIRAQGHLANRPLCRVGGWSGYGDGRIGAGLHRCRYGSHLFCSRHCDRGAVAGFYKNSTLFSRTSEASDSSGHAIVWSCPRTVIATSSPLPGCRAPASASQNDRSFRVSRHASKSSSVFQSIGGKPGSDSKSVESPMKWAKWVTPAST